MKVRRTGELIALSEADTATSAYSSHTERSPANACAASPADTAALQLLITSTSLRRSTASAMVPPSSPIATVGITSATPMAPTASGDRVMSYTCSGTANMVSAPPTADSVVPAHNRRKAGDSRSGLTSASSRPARTPVASLPARRTTGRNLTPHSLHHRPSPGSSLAGPPAATSLLTLCTIGLHLAPHWPDHRLTPRSSLAAPPAAALL